MKVSKNKRGYLAGKALGLAISALVELFYQERTAMGFVLGLKESMERLHKKREKSYEVMLARERRLRQQKKRG